MGIMSKYHRFREAGEPVTLIDTDYAETVAELLDRLP